jgi:hypothetical protein
MFGDFKKIAWALRILIVFAMAGGGSCQSRLKVKTVASPKSPAPAETPVEKPGTSRQIREIAYAGTDLVAQTGSVNRLRFTSEIATDAYEIWLQDADEEERQLVLDPSKVRECAGIYCYKLPSRTRNSDGTELFLKYGDNNLKLLGVTPDEDRVSKLKIQLRDFQIFGLLLLRPVSESTGLAALAPAPAGTLQSISLLTVPVPPQSGEPAPNPLDPIMISNWQEAVERP